MKDTLWECINEKKTSHIPIWFMRQAGRYLPEFRKIRKQNPNFIKLCLNTNLVSEITLQPLNRFDLDAAIIFSDILIIPYALGQKVEFRKGFGPVLGDININNIINTDPKDFIQKLLPVYEGIKKVKTNLKKKSLIGFVGAPWTILLYMLNKQSPKNNFDFNKINKNIINNLLEKIEEIICLHACKQIEAGANVIQIFDSWAGLLPKKELSNYCYGPTLKVVEYIKSKKIPVICFPKGIGDSYVDFCSTVKPDCISIDYEVDPKWIKEKLNGMPIQGGLDPKILLEDEDKEKIKKNTENYLNIFKDYPYIFNLGHGVLPETKPETIEYIIEIIRNKK